MKVMRGKDGKRRGGMRGERMSIVMSTVPLLLFLYAAVVGCLAIVRK